MLICAYETKFGIKSVINIRFVRLSTVDKKIFSKSTFENILREFISVIILKFNNTSLWSSILDSLTEIGSFIEKSQDSEKMPSFDAIIVDKMVDLLAYDDSKMPFST